MASSATSAGPWSRRSCLSPNASVTGDFLLPDWAQDASDRTVAVLGADGFIGNRVVLCALEAGARVVAICAKEPWRLKGVTCDRLEIDWIRGVRWWSTDAIGRLGDRLHNFDAAIFLHYRPPVGVTIPQRLKEELSINTATAARVARAAAEAGARLVFASSADVYGPWHDHPIAENAVPRPASPYAKAKLEAERLIAEKCAPDCYSCLRLATVYGPGEDGPRAIPSFIRSFSLGSLPVVNGSGTDTRDYVHVDDVATSFMNAAVTPRIDGILNIGSGVGRTTLEVLAVVATAMGAAPQARHALSPRPPSRLVLDTRRAKECLGFRSRLDFAAEVEEEASWLRERLAAAD